MDDDKGKCYLWHSMTCKNNINELKYIHLKLQAGGKCYGVKWSRSI